MIDTPDLSEFADAFMAQAYGGVDDEADCLAHCREVADLLGSIGCEKHVVVAGLLHDVVEDTPVAVDEVRERFGERVAVLVDALTEDESIEDYRQRKLLLRAAIADAGYVAMAIFAADKLARVRAADRAGLAIETSKLEHYRRSSELFAANGVRTPHAVELERRLRRGRLPRGSS